MCDCAMREFSTFQMNGCCNNKLNCLLLIEKMRPYKLSSLILWEYNSNLDLNCHSYIPLLHTVNVGECMNHINGMGLK